jgi:dolichol kinase
VGALLFPISLLLCAALYWPLDPRIFQGASLILGLSDSLAGLVGRRFGRLAYRLTGPKTVEGSLTFFAVTLILLLCLADWPDLRLAAGGALALTLVEALCSRGWDNLTVPLLAGLIIYGLG